MRRALTLGATATAAALLLGLAPGATGAVQPTASAVDAALSGPALAAALAALPATDQPLPPALVNDEVAVATLDPTGLPSRALLLSRLSARGEAREVRDPASVTNVRYLDRLGRPSTEDGEVLLTVGGARDTVLTQARFDKPLPVALHAEYALDGAVVPATVVPGAAGTVTVTYTLTNTTAEQVELTWADAAGVERTEQRAVFAPFQGALTVTLPQGATLVDAPDAALATDAQGRTVAHWAIVLHPPISAPIQTVELTMQAQRAGVPQAQLELVPVTSAEDPGDAFASSLLDGVTAGNVELYDGLLALDAGADGLSTGSDALARGLGELAGGAGTAAAASGALAAGIGDLAAGATGVADASGTLAGGIGDLAGGADEVATGSAALGEALGQASGGADALADSTAQLAAAATAGAGQDPVAPLLAGGLQIEAGLREATARVGGPADPVLDPLRPIPPDGDDTCPAGGTAPPDDDCVTIYQAVRLIRDGVRTLDRVVDAVLGQADTALAAAQALADALADAQLDTSTAANGARDLHAALCLPTPPTLDAASCQQLLAVADAAQAADGTLVSALPVVDRLVQAATTLSAQADAIGDALDAAVASAERLLAAVEALGVGLGQGTPTQPGLTAAMVALNEGLRTLSAGLAGSQQQLAVALDQVASGNAALADGLADADRGAGALAAGAGQLATGAGEAAAGADRLAEGSEQLAQGAGQAEEGATGLQAGVERLASGTQAAAGAGGELASGARRLQQEGTAPAAASVLEASTEPAEAAAWLAAADARAADALPYGAPDGAVGHVAYQFTLPEVAAPMSLWERIRAMFG